MSDDQPTVPPEPLRSEPFGLIAGLIERVTRVEDRTASQEGRILGLENSVKAMSGQLEGVTSQAGRLEGDVKQMRAALDQIAAGQVDLQHGLGDIKGILTVWTPVLVATQKLLEVKAEEEKVHSIELNLIRERQDSMARWAKRGVGLVTTLGALAGSVLALANMNTLLSTLARNTPLLAVTGLGVVALLWGLVRALPLSMRKKS